MLSIAGFSIDVISDKSSSDGDSENGDWLNVSCVCVAKGARIEISGSLVRLSDLSQFAKDLRPLYADLKGTATLAPLEPCFELTFTEKSHGKFEFQVDITPDHLAQKHLFTFNVDQTHIGITIEWIERLLKQRQSFECQ